MSDRPRPKRGEQWNGATYLSLASTYRSAQGQPEASAFGTMARLFELYPPDGMENEPAWAIIRRPLSPTEDAAVRSFRNAAIWALKDGRGHEEAFEQILLWGAKLLLRFNEWGEAGFNERFKEWSEAEARREGTES